MVADTMTNRRWLQISPEEVISEPAPDISPIGFAISAVPVVIVLLISLYLRLGNAQVLIVASIRCVAQLMILGLILYPVFVNNQPYVVLPYIFIMVAFATREANVKPKHRYRGMGWHMLLSLTVGLAISFAIITGLVLRPNPWWNASVMIPLSGMLMGSSVNALSLGMDKLLMSLSDSGGRGSARLQTYLACGATSWEASLPSVREAIETGLTPNLNQMSIMGLVSIPGMMAGQILGGTSPLVAAKYQVVIMFFICSNSTTVLFGTIVQAVFWSLFDSQHRFQSNLVLKRKGGKPKDIVLAFIHFVCGALGFVKSIQDDNGEDSPSGSVTTRRESLIKKWSSTHISHSRKSTDRKHEDGTKRGTFVSETGPTKTSRLLHLKNGEIVYPNSLHLSSLEVVINGE
jgi:putative ABC transport system permease protein